MDKFSYIKDIRTYSKCNTFQIQAQQGGFLDEYHTGISCPKMQHKSTLTSKCACCCKQYNSTIGLSIYNYSNAYTYKFNVPWAAEPQDSSSYHNIAICDIYHNYCGRRPYKYD